MIFIPQRGPSLATGACRAFLFLARRAAGRRPRHEPWVSPTTTSLALKGRHFRWDICECHVMRRTKVSPLRAGCCVGSVPHGSRRGRRPAALRAKTQDSALNRPSSHKVPSQRRSAQPPDATSPNHRMSQCKYPRCLGISKTLKGMAQPTLHWANSDSRTI